MSIQKFTISRDDSIYHAWPDVALTSTGKLICVFSECISHIDRSYTRVMMTESIDRGRTWSPKKPLSEEARGSVFWNNARITRLSDGCMVVVCDSVYDRPALGATNYLWFSDSDSARWDGPFETPVKGVVPDKVVELPGGRWLLAAHHKNSVTGYLEEDMWYSDDKGTTWKGPVTLVAKEGLNLCEASILPLPGGELVAFLRENSGEGWDCYKSISFDNGESWQGVYRVPLPGCHRPVAGMLKSGRVMISYRFMQGGKGWLGSWAQNLFVALTDAESAKATNRKEQWSRILPVDYDRSSHSDLGYTGWVQFDDGEIYIVNYIVDDAPKGQIRGYSLREEDFYIDSPKG